MKKSFLDINFCKATNIKEQAKRALLFLVENYKLIELSEVDIKKIKSFKSLTNSPIDQLFTHINDANKLDKYFLMELNKIDIEDIPEILTMSEISIDGSSISSNVPENLKKLWINLTPIMKKRITTYSPIEINDLNKFQGMIVRSSLVRSYDNSDIWLTPKIAAFIIKSYSITISSIVKRTYNLDIIDTEFIQTLFAVYYAQLLGPTNGPFKIPPLLNRCGFLGSINEIERRLEKILPYRENNGEDILEPYKICDILSQVGPARMKNFNVNNLYRFIAMGPIDSQSMMISLDYPPYFVFQILRTLSGTKNYVLNNVLKMPQLKRDIEAFVEDLNKSRYIEQL